MLVRGCLFLLFTSEVVGSLLGYPKPPRGLRGEWQLMAGDLESCLNRLVVLQLSSQLLQEPPWLAPSYLGCGLSPTCQEMGTSHLCSLVGGRAQGGLPSVEDGKRLAKASSSVPREVQICRGEEGWAQN